MDAAVGSSVYRGCVGSYWGDQAVLWPDSQRIAGEVETTALIVTEGKNTGVQLLGELSRVRPTAVVCANDLFALGLSTSESAPGWVPDELAIVGYEDLAAAVALSPVRQPRWQLGRTAATLLVREEQEADDEHEQVLVCAELVVRRTKRTVPVLVHLCSLSG